MSLEPCPMTKEQAEQLKRFDHSCTCGGYARSMNRRPASRPHMEWCPQKPQYDAWWDALHAAPRAKGDE